MKLAVVLYAASYAVRKAAFLHARQPLKQTLLRGFLPLFAVMIAIGALLLLEPDFGAFVVIVAIAFGILFLGGLDWRLFARRCCCCCRSGSAAILVAAPYRLQRLAAFLDPWSDPYGKGYQLSHSLIAFGRGEWFGVGLGAIGREALLPARGAHRFPARGDRRGAGLRRRRSPSSPCSSGCSFARMRSAGRRRGSQRPFASLVAHGIGMWIGVQAFINIGVNMGVLPTKGLTLPLLSFGGSGIVANCIAIALLLRVDLENRRCCAGSRHDGNGDDHHGRHRRPRVSRPRGRGEARRTRLARVLARHARRAWRRGSCRSTASSSRASRSAASAARDCGSSWSARSRCSPRCWQSRGSSARRAPDVVLGFGGFASFPGALMGVACAKPLVLHDAECRRGTREPRARVRRGSHSTGISGRAARTARGEGRVGRQSGARRDRRVAAARGALRRPRRAAPAARRRRQPRRRGVERVRAGGARAVAVGRRGRGSFTRRARGISTRCAPPTRDAGVAAECIAVHRRHGGALRGRRSSCSAAAARSPWPSSPRSASARSSSRCPGAIADEQSANARFLVDAGAAIMLAQRDLTPRAAGRVGWRR